MLIFVCPLQQALRLGVGGGVNEDETLNSPLRLRVQSRSGRRSTIATSIAVLFGACYQGLKWTASIRHLMLGPPQPGTEVSGALRARNPKESNKRVRKGVLGPPASGSPRAPKSPKLFLDSFRTPGRTLWALWSSPGPEARDTFSDSFWTLLGFRARETSVPGRRGSQTWCENLL